METIINYSTYDFPFISEVIKQAEIFSDKVFVVYYDYFFDGVPEDTDKIANTLKLTSLKTEFICINWDSTKNSKFHHNNARWEGLKRCKQEYILFLNSDEILEGSLVRDFIKSGEHLQFDAIAFECYWYFREPIYQAIQTEQIGFIIKRNICSAEYIFDDNETMAFKYTHGLKIKEFVRYNNRILCHHYSWARSKSDMLRKVVSWGHRNDRNWSHLVNEEFSREFNGRDFVHGYSYNIVDNFFNIQIKNEVTLLCVSGHERYLNNAIKAAEYSNRKNKFKTKILSNKYFEHHSIQYVSIPDISNIEEYSEFCLTEMIKYVETSHVLIFQPDGFILDSDLWNDEFFNYDYIGAPWPLWMNDKYPILDHQVGNGGFSLRSRKLLEEVAKLREVDREIIPEDVFISRKHRKFLEQRGMKWAPVELAAQFSIEHPLPENTNDQQDKTEKNTFGFHAKAGISCYLALL